MKLRRKIAIATVSVVLCYAPPAGAESEPLRLLTPARCTTEGGSTVDLAPGRYLPEHDWNALDAEIRRLQERETRLAAENEALRSSATPGRSTWVVAGLALAAGISIGVYASR